MVSKQKEIQNNIDDINRKQYFHRKQWLSLDIKKINLKYKINNFK